MIKHAVAILSLILICSGYVIGRAWGERPVASSLLKATFFDVCKLVDEYYFENTPALHRWVKHCNQEASGLPDHSNLHDLIFRIQTELPKLPVSHLDFWDPGASRLLWDGLSHETGLRVRELEHHWIISEIIPESPAERSHLQAGDEVLTCDGHLPLDEFDLRFKAVKCEVKHEGHSITVDLTGEDVQLDQNPEIFELDAHTAWLRIPSFLSAFLDGEEWKTVAGSLNKYNRIIIDVRGNGGGYFVTMLKAASPFFCQPTNIGKLVQPRKGKGPVAEFAADSTFEEQNTLVDASRIVNLRTYDGYPCIHADVRILIDQQTASTAEIFASAFRLRSRARVMGERTAGAVVLASWFPLPLGTGYRISIPQAMFETPSGERIEGVGLAPQVMLQYRLDEAREGNDSWLLRASEP